MLSFDNLPISNDILKSLYVYGLTKPSSLHFDLIRIFLSNSNVLIEKPYYLIEKYESIAIASLQSKGNSLIVLEDRRSVDNLYELYQHLNKLIKRTVSKNINKSFADINIITIDTFNKNFSKFIDPENLFDSVYLYTTNQNIIKYIEFCNQLYTNNKCKLTFFYVFDYSLENNELLKYKYFDKYYNNKMNQFEPKQLRNYYVVADSYFEIMNGNCIDSIYENNSIEQSVIYLENSTNVMSLYRQLIKKDFPVCYYHEDMTMIQLEKSIESFMSGNSRICICSDKSNLDFIKTLTNYKMNFERISHVIHLDLPKIEYYLLRIPYTIETKHIFVMNLNNENSFEHKQVLEDYFNIKMKFCGVTPPHAT